jgi:hypothetical protein
MSRSETCRGMCSPQINTTEMSFVLVSVYFLSVMRTEAMETGSCIVLCAVGVCQMDVAGHETIWERVQPVSDSHRPPGNGRSATVMGHIIALKDVQGSLLRTHSGKWVVLGVFWKLSLHPL